MIVGGGTAPATNLTRHEVQRPRPPHVAVMSTEASCAALRMVVPGSTSRARLSGRRVSAGLIRRPGYHFQLDFPRAFADSDTHPSSRWGYRGGCIAPLHRLPPPVADPDPAGHGPRPLPRHARDPRQPARSGGRGSESALARGAEEPRRG